MSNEQKNGAGAPDEEEDFSEAQINALLQERIHGFIPQALHLSLCVCASSFLYYGIPHLRALFIKPFVFLVFV